MLYKILRWGRGIWQQTREILGGVARWSPATAKQDVRK